MNELELLADQMAEKFGVRKELFRATINQESRWNTQAVSPAGAEGLGQVMPATGRDPGYGVKPMQDNSPQENLRFSAEYLGKMISLTGAEDLGLAAYNAGYGAVLKHKGIPPYKETQDYVAKILGTTPAQPTKTQALASGPQGYGQYLAERAAVINDPALMDGVVIGQTLQGNSDLIFETVAQRAVEREKLRTANIATAGDVFQNSVVNETLSGGLAQLWDAGPQDDWKPSAEQKDEELASGILNIPHLNAYVQGFRNEQDYQHRLASARMQMGTMQRSSNATGAQSAVLFMAGMAGAAADPVAAVASLGIAAPLNALRVARATWAGMRGLRVGAAAAEGALSNALVSAGVQNALNTEVSSSRIIGDAIFGAAFGAAISAPAQGISARRQAQDAAHFTELGAALGVAVDNNAPELHVQQLQRNLDEVRGRMVQRAREQGDVIAAEVWNAAGPGTDAPTISRIIGDMQRRTDEAVEGIDPVHEAGNTRPITQMAEGSGTVEIAGMRQSTEATAIRDYAYNVWREDIPAPLKEMQANLKQWYEAREGKLKNYGGLTQWLDSPGLTVQLSKSKVARMLGAHLFESASGLGKREQSAALNYEMLHSRLAHRYLPGLKQALQDAIKEAHGMLGVAQHITGGGRAAENAFWKAVMAERTARRNAVKNKQEWASTAPEPVQRAGKLMDRFYGESSALLEKAGIEEGTAIRQGGIVGHVPYVWDNQRIAEAFRSEPEMFNAFRDLLMDEYRHKLLNRLTEQLEAEGPKMLAERRTQLEGDIAAFQDEIAKVENLRKTVDTARDVAQDAEAVAADLNAQRKAIVKAEKALKAQLKNAPDGPQAAPVEQQMVGTIEEVVIDDPRVDAGIMRTVFAGLKNKAELEADPSYTRFTGADLLGQIGAIRDRLPPAGQLLYDALLNDFGDAAKELDVFVSRNAGVSHYAGGSHLIKMDGVWSVGKLAPSEAMTALHELSHARTSNWLHIVERTILNRSLSAMPDGKMSLPRWAPVELVDVAAAPAHLKDAAAAWNKLEGVRGELMKRHPELIGGTTNGVGYAMMNNHELIAQVFNSPTTRAAMDAIKLEGNVSLLRRVWEAVAEFLSKGRTGVTEVVEAIDMLSGMQGKWRYSGIDDSRLVNFAPVPSKADIKAQMAELKSQKAALDAKLTEVRKQRSSVQAERKAVNAADAAKQLKNLRLQLDNRKAQLADMQRDPLGWWAGEVNKVRTAAEAKAKALTSAYLQKVITDPEARLNNLSLHTTRLAEDLLKENWAGAKVTPELADSFAKLLQERLSDRTRTEFDLGKEVQVNGRGVSMMDFLQLDGLAQVKSGSHTYSGQIALAKMGIKDDVGAAAALQAAQADGADEATLKALKFGLDFLGDKLRGTDPAALHALRNMTYFTRMGKLGMSVVADVPQLFGTLGVGLALKVWGKSFLQLSLNGKKAYRGKPTEFAKQLAVVAPGALGRDHRLITMVPDNPANGAADLAAMTLMQRVSARGAQLTSFVSGANAVNMAMHRALLPVLAEELIKATRGKSALNDVRLTDAGLDPAMLQRIRAQLDQFDAGRKEGDGVNWNKWEDQEAADVLIGAIHRSMYQTLQKGLLGEKPQWLADSALGRLIGQFRSFGLTSAEKQSARQGAGYRDTRVAVTAAMGLAWAGMIYYARVHFNAAGKANQEEYIEKQLQPFAVARGVMTLWSLSGLLADGMNIGQLMFGGGTYGQSASPAAALGTLTDITKAAGAVGGLATGGTEGAEAAAATMRLMPGANSIPMTYFINELLKD